MGYSEVGVSIARLVAFARIKYDNITRKINLVTEHGNANMSTQWTTCRRQRGAWSRSTLALCAAVSWLMDRSSNWCASAFSVTSPQGIAGVFPAAAAPDVGRDT